MATVVLTKPCNRFKGTKSNFKGKKFQKTNQGSIYFFQGPTLEEKESPIILGDDFSSRTDMAIMCYFSDGLFSIFQKLRTVLFQ